MSFRILNLLLASALLAGVYGQLPAREESSNPRVTAEQAERAIEAAEAARKRAAEAGAEWLRTGALIEEARNAAKSEQWQEAFDRAGQARRQADLAIEQAAQESTAWRARVVH
jgi:hypothetical protein